MEGSHWIPLRLHPPSSESLLLTKCSFEPTAYQIWLTDLSRIWTVSADRRQIIRQALNDDVSIDPSEDASQLQILLRKVKNSLNGQEGSVSSQSIENAENVVLEINAPLPSPLRPLHWLLHFQSASAEDLKREVIVPLFELSYTLQRRENDLVSIIKEKDHIVSKLLDRLEASGADLTTIFPGAAGIKTSKHSNVRGQIAKYIKGLGQFDEEIWRIQASSSNPQSASLEEVVSATCAYLSKTSPTVSTPLYQDARSLPPSVQKPTISSDLKKNPGGSPEENPNTKDVESDDEFQRQATPPSLRNTRSPRKAESTAIRIKREPNSKIHDDDTTDDEDSDDPKPEPQANRTRSWAPTRVISNSPAPMAINPRPNSKKLGMIGKGRKKHSKEQEEPNAREDIDLDEGPAEISNVPRRAKIGMIGGGKKSRNFAPSETDHAEQSQSNEANRGAQQPTAETSQRVITTTIEEKARSSMEANYKLDAKSPSPETEKAKADRKRQELKDELQRKAPAARKRRKL